MEEGDAQYLLKEKEQKPELSAKAVGGSEVNPMIEAPAEETSQNNEEVPTVDDSEASPAAAEEGAEASAGESTDSSPASETTDDANAAIDESNDSPESENSDDQEAEEIPAIKIETAPADFRFPTTNQTRHCFTRYIEYHRCVAAKGEGAPECEKFAKYYRSLCPGEWVDRWNEQRENGTFPGPL
ncbi:cytochrome c oxidase subunit 6b-1 [Dorcoceras hygrometricum]|uniref:Cytochrome c oxidase subunit 6b-1 n=1 Tax=Dorcoceras hygrometricum TaxID=472368 RepID=A0A2Z7BAN8_9LAMI|nr:cytochrome c oxidase subunit 6b-1 [Dorcoceras hygrometricum]